MWNCFGFNLAGFIFLSLISSTGRAQDLKLNSIYISNANPRGGGELTLYGSGFSESSKVKLGDRSCGGVLFISEEKIRCVAPSSPTGTSAEVDVTVQSSGQVVVLAEAFHYLERIEVNPSAKQCNRKCEITFLPDGGATPYHFKIISGEGKIGAENGHFRASDQVGFTLIRVNDSRGSWVDATVEVRPDLELAPRDKQISLGSKFRWIALGGSPPYRFSVVSGGGSIETDTGVYEANGDFGSVTVRVTDSNETSAEIQFNVYPGLRILPGNSGVAVGKTLTFRGEGGTPPYRFRVLGAGSIDSSGVYSAPDKPGEGTTVQVFDQDDNQAETTVRIVPTLAIAPTNQMLIVGDTSKFYALGGLPPYTFKLMEGPGKIDEKTGLYRTPADLGVGSGSATVSVRAEDSIGQTADAVIMLLSDYNDSVKKIASGYAHSCVLFEGSVQCWGINRNGQLGNLDAGKFSKIPVLVEGLNERVKSVVSGLYHTCALEDGAVKCWGDNTFGQLAASLEIKQSAIPLEIPDLSEGVHAIAAGGFHSCAIKNGSILCWGKNGFGQVGRKPVLTKETNTAIVTTPFEAIPNGVESISAGMGHTCAIANRTVYCWGVNGSGQLGNGNLRDHPSPVVVEKIDGLVDTVVAGGFHTCITQRGQLKCWGYNGTGQLNKILTENYQLPRPVEGITEEVMSVGIGSHHSCIVGVVAGGSNVKCWGINEFGQLGLKPDKQWYPPQIVPGLGTDMEAIAPGVDHTCALGKDRFWCWGRNNSGQLGDKTLKDRWEPFVVQLKKIERKVIEEKKE